MFTAWALSTINKDCPEGQSCATGVVYGTLTFAFFVMVIACGASVGIMQDNVRGDVIVVAMVMMTMTTTTTTMMMMMMMMMMMLSARRTGSSGQFSPWADATQKKFMIVANFFYIVFSVLMMMSSIFLSLATGAIDGASCSTHHQWQPLVQPSLLAPTSRLPRSD
jgi:hypothetical protein